jgi:hypothetical protein
MRSNTRQSRNASIEETFPYAQRADFSSSFLDGSTLRDVVVRCVRSAVRSSFRGAV